MRAISLVAAVGASAYVATLLVVPLLDRDVDALRAYPEDYASGPAGMLVRLGYVAVALMALAIGVSLLREGARLERLAAILLAAGSATALVLAAAPQQVTGGALLIGVLALVIAPILVSVGGRRRLPSVVVVLGIVTCAGFLALALAPRDVAGMTNRAWDVLLGVWGLSFALTTKSGIVGARR